MGANNANHVNNANENIGTSKELDGELKRLVRFGLLANCSLLVGGSMNVGFYARELVVAWWTRDVTGDVLYLFAFAAIAFSALLEFVIDLVFTRTFGHGRYTTKKRLNQAITVLFLMGTIGDLIAFVFWREGKTGLQEEHITQWVSSHIFLLTAILVLITNRPRYVPFQNGMDSIANILFFCESLLACCARYFTTVGNTKRNPTESALELASAAVGVTSAFCYVLADIIRWRNPNSILHSYC